MVTQTQALTPPWTHTLTPVHAQTDGEMVRGDFAGCWSRTEGGRVGKERAREEGGKIEGGEKA